MREMVELAERLLATWRVSLLLVEEAGPYNVFGRLRKRAGVRADQPSDAAPREPGELGKMLSCVWCASVWVGLSLTIVQRVCPWLVRCLAASAGAIALYEWMYDEGEQDEPMTLKFTPSDNFREMVGSREHDGVH